MIVLFYGVKLFYVHFKINYNGPVHTVGSGLLAQTTTPTLQVTALAGLELLALVHH